jgi:sporulation protein YlmC with PRC-barrel domain
MYLGISQKSSSRPVACTGLLFSTMLGISIQPSISSARHPLFPGTAFSSGNHFTNRRTFMKVNSSLFKNVGVSILFIVGSSQAFAQSPQMTQKQQDQTVRQQQTGQQGMQQSQNLVGKKVTTQSGGMLGTVEEVIQDSSGNERYAVLSRGQGGRKAITVPLQRINQQGQGDALTANVDLSSLQQLTRQQGQQQQSEPEKALDQILGQNVQGQQGEKLGTINNIVIGTEGGPMVVMQGENQSNYPIPLQALQQQQGQQGFRIDQDKQNFQTAPSYRDKFIDLRQWRDVIYAYYGLESQQVAQQSQQQRPPQATQRSQQQPQATQRSQQQEPPQAAQQSQQESAGITVRQPAPQVQVQQPQPQVQVRQAQPEIVVRQQPPEVTVTQPPPQVEVTQPAPQIEVTQPEPQVRVTQPQPQVEVSQAQPEVEVRMPQPEVQVAQPEPEVSVQQAQPEVEVQRSQPQVDIQQEQQQPRVTVQRQEQPKVTVQKQGEPQISVQRQGEPQVNVAQRGQEQQQQRQQAQSADQSRREPGKQ